MVCSFERERRENFSSLAFKFAQHIENVLFSASSQECSASSLAVLDDALFSYSSFSVCSVFADHVHVAPI